MAASTIARSTLTDNVTIWNAALVNSAIYDKIDNMLAGGGAYATLTLGGALAVEGFGQHNVSASGTGGNILAVRNTAAGTGNYGALHVGNNSAADRVRLLSLSTTFTSAAEFQADGATLVSTGAGGLQLAATNAAGVIRLYTGSTPTEYAKLNATGKLLLRHGGATYDENYAPLSITGPGTNFGQQISLIRSGAAVWSLGFVYNTSTLAIGTGQSTDSNFTAANAALQITTGNLLYIRDGSAAGPALAFADDPDSGLYRSAANTVHIGVGATSALSVARTATPLTLVSVASSGNGTGAIPGNQLLIGRNSSGNGAAGTLQFVTLDGDAGYIWVDATGDLRIHTDAPTESGSVADTAGTVIGDQTSTRESKEAITPYEDYAGALALIEQTPLRTFRYRRHTRNGTTFVGIVADEAPAFVMDPAEPGGLGRVFNPINAFGYTAAAIKALAARVLELESRT